MKSLNNFILERLKLTKASKINQYLFHPTNFWELRKLLERLLDERGKDAYLNDIDVSKVESFYDSNKDLGLFENLDPHNIDISEWNVFNVTNMRGVFYKCENFDCDLSKWNVSKVEDMRWMFYNCKNFNCNLSNWNVSNVKNMRLMFGGCENFKGDGLEKWKVSKVKTMYSMFGGCLAIKNKPSWYKE